MLIESRRHHPTDLRAWARHAAHDAAWATTSRFRDRVDAAEMAVVRFAREPGGYCAVSWGKDSVVVADIVARLAPHVPLVWVRVEPISSPECTEVRDRFLDRHDVAYDEIVTHCRVDRDGVAHATGTLERGFAQAVKRHGERRIYGLRSDESSGRDWFRRMHGRGTDKVCAPIIDWAARDIWAYLHEHDLPIHPAYAMTHGGALGRDRIRVASLGGERGTGTGRREWEEAYYPEFHRRRHRSTEVGT